MKQRGGTDAGQDLVEYALVLPIFLLLVLSVIEFGVLFYQYNVVANAAREGARAGIVMETAACSAACLKGNVISAARAISAGLEPSKLTVTPHLGTTPSDYGTFEVSVTVTYRTHFMTEMLIEAVGGHGDVTLESTATMQREF